MCSKKVTHSMTRKTYTTQTNALIYIDFKHSVIWLGKRPRYKTIISILNNE